MPSSLLSECSLVFQGPLAASDEVFTQWSHDWPQGHANARIVEEYLVGRAVGVLDISGRQWRTEAPPAEAPPASGTASPAAVESVHTMRAPHALTSPPTVVLDDPDGGLVLAAALSGATRVAVVGDSVAAIAACQEAVAALPDALRSAVAFYGSLAEAVAALAGDGAGPELDAGRLRVIVDAPKQMAVMREYLRVVGADAVEVVVVGRDKHLSSRLNGLLGEAYADVHVSPGRAKSRLLIAHHPKKPAVRGLSEGDGGALGDYEARGGVQTRRRTPKVPAQNTVESPVKGVPAIRISAFAGTFGGASVDPGARLLVQAVADHFHGAVGEGMRVLDLGCGNGWLLAALGGVLPKASLYGVDVSRAAVESAALTVASVRPGENPAVLAHLDATNPLPWDDRFQVGRFDVVTLNPPFHEGTAVTTETAHALIRNATDLVAPGGRLVVVYNSHLRYRSHLQHRLINVVQWARDRRFTVVTGTLPDTTGTTGSSGTTDSTGTSGARGETRTPTS